MRRLSASPSSYLFFAHILSLLTFLLVVSSIVKRQPNLKSRYRQCVEAAIEYTRTIEDSDNLVNLRTLTLRCYSFPLLSLSLFFFLNIIF